MTKVAIQISQSPRTILRCAPSILGFIDRSVHEVDVYFYMWENEFPLEMKDAVDSILLPRLGKGKGVWATLPDIEEIAAILRSLPRHEWADELEKRVLWSSYAIGHCHALCASTDEYDWVVSVRPDLEFGTQNLNLDKIIVDDEETTIFLPQKAHYRGWNCQMAILPGKAANVYAKFHDWMTQVLPTDVGAAINQEVLIKRYLSNFHNFKKIDLPIDYKIVRTRFVDLPYERIPHHSPRDHGGPLNTPPSTEGRM